jgi:hypothetical protein
MKIKLFLLRRQFVHYTTKMPNWAGPRFTLLQSVTTHDMLTIVNMLSAAFGPQYTLKLESITEGGIIFTNWPGKSSTVRNSYTYSPTGYKSFRINVLNNGYWGLVNEEKWKNDPSKIIWNVPLRLTNPVRGIRRLKRLEVKGYFFLKAYDGAPDWTQAEVDVFVRVFEVYGFKCTHKKLKL